MSRDEVGAPGATPAGIHPEQEEAGKMKSEVRTTHEEHEPFYAQLDEMKGLADSIGDIPVEQARSRAAGIHEFMAHTVMPHAVAEGVVLFPIVREESGEPTIGVRMTQCHVQLSGLVDELEGLLVASGKDPSVPVERELRRILYSLYAVLSAHLAEGDEEIEPLLDANLPPKERQEMFQAVERCAREVAELYE
jgi:Hemerythrin HHE cation binding domain